MINNQIRVVYDGRYDWVNARGLADKPVNGIIFDSYEDAWAWIDKFSSLGGKI